jgi:hypothetical protein
MKHKRNQLGRSSNVRSVDEELTNMVAIAFRCRREAGRRERAAAAQLAKKLGINKKMGTLALDLLQHAAQKRFGFGWKTWVATMGLDQRELIAASRCRKWIPKASTALILVISASLGCRVEHTALNSAIHRPCGSACEVDQAHMPVEACAGSCNRDLL